MINLLPAPTQTLYAELRERLLAESARRSVGKAPGTFTTKTLGAKTYVYFQYSEPGGRSRQLYLGRKESGLERLMRRFETGDGRRARAPISSVSALRRFPAGLGHGRPSRVLKASLTPASSTLAPSHRHARLGVIEHARHALVRRHARKMDLAAVRLPPAAAMRTQADLTGWTWASCPFPPRSATRRPRSRCGESHASTPHASQEGPPTARPIDERPTLALSGLSPREPRRAPS